MPRFNETKRTAIRNKIITGADKYNKFLMNKVFLVICEDGSLHNVRFFAKDFQHLTGIHSDLSQKDFFEKALNKTLTVDNILEQQKYDGYTLKYKTNIIENIEKNIYGDSSESLFMLNLHTKTFDYPVAIRNSGLKGCVGFKQTNHRARTIRKYANSNNADKELKIIGIFSKSQEESKYTEFVYLSDIEVFSALELDMKLFSNEIVGKLTIQKEQKEQFSKETSDDEKAVDNKETTDNKNAIDNEETIHSEDVTETKSSCNN